MHRVALTEKMTRFYRILSGYVMKKINKRIVLKEQFIWSNDERHTNSLEGLFVSCLVLWDNTMETFILHSHDALSVRIGALQCPCKPR